MLLLWQEGSSYWEVGDRLRLHRHRRRPRRDAGLALAHRLGAGAAGRDGLGHGRPAARPRRRAPDVDLRRAAHRRVRRRRWARRSPPPRTDKVTDSTQSQLQALLRERGGPRRAEPAVRGPDHRRGEVVVPRGRPLGLHGRDRRRPRGRGARLPRVPASTTRSGGSSPTTTPAMRAAAEWLAVPGSTGRPLQSGRSVEP